MEYTVDYFIEKFENVPEDAWGTGCCDDFEGHKCALGLCGLDSLVDDDKMDNYPEAKALCVLFSKYLRKDVWWSNVYCINDYPFDTSSTNPGKEAKERIISTLKKIKNEL
jgi:hypothetical protein